MNNLYLQLRKLIKEQINLRLVEGKKYKLREELSKNYKKKNTSETNIWFILKRENKIDKPLARLIKKKKERGTK